jgi:hypothetical protein
VVSLIEWFIAIDTTPLPTYRLRLDQTASTIEKMSRAIDTLRHVLRAPIAMTAKWSSRRRCISWSGQTLASMTALHTRQSNQQAERTRIRAATVLATSETCTLTVRW